MRPEHWLYTIPLRLRSLFHRRRADEELDDELRDHVERKTEDYVAKGLVVEEARRQALLEMGGIEKRKEECRDSRHVTWIQDLVQDLHFGLRMLRKNPGFTAVAVLTLALGIGANTIVFSVVNAFLLREPPVRDPDRVVLISSVNPAKDVYAPDRTPVSALDYFDWRAQSSSFSSMAAAAFDDFTVSGGAAAQWVPGARVSASFFDVLGVYPVLGRAIRPDENQAGRDQAVILSNRLWEERFGGDPRAIGQSIKVNGNRCTVVGVMPRGFRLLGEFHAELWIPLVPLRDNLLGSGREDRYLQVFAKLKPGVTVGRGNTEMQTIAQRIAQAHPNTDQGWGAKVVSLHEFDIAASGSEPASLFLSVAVGFVLLIACTNLASLLLARNAARRHEFSVRSALGAGRLRLERQLLTECLLLSSMGGGVGILLGTWGVRALRAGFSWNADAVADARGITMDGHVLTFTLVLSVAAALLFGLVPAIQVTRRSAGEGLKEAHSLTGGRGRNRLQRLLVVGQVALSLFLLVGAGIFVDLFVEEVRTRVGFNPNSLLTASVPLRGVEYFSPQRQAQFFESLRQRLVGIPGVQSVALATDLPFNFPGYVHFTVDGHSVAKPSDEPMSGYFAVSPDYFATAQIPLLRGREFARSDVAGSMPVVIINQALASRFFPGQDPIGRHIRFDSHKQSSEIIGIAANVREFLAQTEPRPELFVPFEQEPSGTMRIVVRTRTKDPASISDSLRRAVWAVDPGQAVTEIRTMNRVIADSATGDNLVAEMMGTFALLALFIAAIGIFGLLSHVVSRRTHEIGIRLALGSKPSQILRLVLRGGMTLVIIGTVVGFVASLALPKLIAASFQSQNFGTLHRMLVFAGGPVVLLSVAFAACYIPARRAMRVDPMVALRYE